MYLRVANGSGDIMQNYAQNESVIGGFTIPAHENAVLFPLAQDVDGSRQCFTSPSLYTLLLLVGSMQ